MLVNLNKSDPLPTILSCLHYGNSGPICQQVCLVSEPDGQKTFIGLTFISLFSKYLASIINDCQNDVPIIVVPIQCHIIKLLLKFLSTGKVVCKDIEDVFCVGKAADVLGIANENWKIETSEDCNVDNNNEECKIYIPEDVSAESFVFPMKDIKLQLSCDICGKIYQSEAELDGHKLLRHDLFGIGEAAKSKCPVCSMCLKKREHLPTHVFRHFQGFRRFACDQCKASFKRKEHLDTHIKTHRSQKKIVNELGPLFSRRNEGKNVNVPGCDVCGKKYKTRGNLISHKISNHSSPSPATINQCPICKKTVKYVKTSGDLGRHIDLHLSDRKRYHPCNKCNSSFYEKKTLTYHMRTKHRSDDT